MIAYFKNSLLYTVYLFGASALSLVTSMIPMYITRALTPDEYTRTLVMVISMIISMIITIYILFYQSGYRRKSSHENYKNSELIITLSLTTIIHFIIGLLSKYIVFLYFPVGYLSGLILGEADAESISYISKTHFNIMILSYFLMMIPLIASMMLGFSKGLKKRQKEREKTISKTN
jgi:amino acid permease